MGNSVNHGPTFNGHPIFVSNRQPLGSYCDILQSIFNLFVFMVKKHNKVLFVRIDITYPAEIRNLGDNNHISRFIESFALRFKRRRIDFKYLWVREAVNPDHNPHYHCMFLLDGNKIQNPYGLFEKATALWEKILGTGASGLVDYCLGNRGQERNNGVMLCRNSHDFNQKFMDCFYRASYLAKVYSKCSSPKRVREFGLSRMREG